LDLPSISVKFVSICTKISNYANIRRDRQEPPINYHSKTYEEIMAMIPDWAKEMNCAVTVCDKEGVILYMNDKAKETFASHGDLIGKNLIPCHNERSRGIIADLLATGGSNAYTIQKNGLKKMIYQTAWKENGEVAGLVEISMVIPEDMPHYAR
jgi:PAS domain-containing protein